MRTICGVVFVVALLVGLGAEATMVQDFDGVGTAYTLTQYGTAPGPAVVAGGPTGNFLRLATNNVGNQRGAVGFDRGDSGAFTSVQISFDFRTGPYNGADGIGMAFLNTAVASYGTTGTVNFSEEPNLTASFGLGIDTHDNGAGDLSEDSLSLHWNGAKVAEVDLAGLVDLENNVFNHVHLSLVPSPGGAEATVIVTPDAYGTPGTPVVAFDRTFIAGLTPYEGRLAFAARTGGLNANHDIDNATVVIPEPASLALLALGGLALVRRRRGC